MEIGSMAPEFCLPNQDEIEICSRDLKGKWIVFYFYPKDNTPGCTTEACDFTSSNDSFEDMNAIILGVSPDSPKKHRSFIEKQSLGITLLSDESTQIAQNYGVWQKKQMCGKEYMGIVRSTFIIDKDQNIVKEWRNVRVKNHVEEVTDELKKLI